MPPPSPRRQSHTASNRHSCTRRLTNTPNKSHIARTGCTRLSKTACGQCESVKWPQHDFISLFFIFSLNLSLSPSLSFISVFFLSMSNFLYHHVNENQLMSLRRVFFSCAFDSLVTCTALAEHRIFSAHQIMRTKTNCSRMSIDDDVVDAAVAGY